MLVQVRAVPKHQSTHISYYQSTERESYERDETSLTIFPMCPRERFSHYKKLSRLVLCYKKDWATLLHLIYFHCLLPVTNYLITKLSATYNFSACRESLLKTACHFLLLLVGFDTLTYRKDCDRSPILVGHHHVLLLLLAAAVHMERAAFQCAHATGYEAKLTQGAALVFAMLYASFLF